ncbi:zinc finger MYND domain-containing protein 10-like isoform X2 [Daphnia carinata]|nr:zinc finger MYND domain-containing protein 10-like isoform X2 [Daphnia carinata]
MIYTVLYHEGAVISLLELLLYHSAACEALGDSIVDLIDYCHRTLLRSAATAAPRNPSLADSPLLKHLDVSHLEANIAIRCIAILRFLAGHADNLSEIVTSRMLTTTDVPLLAVQLMDQQPWIRQEKRRRMGSDDSGSRDDDERAEIYDNGQWRPCTDDEASGSNVGQLHPVAAHLWLLLLSLLMSPVAPRKYELNDFRCQQLLKLRSSLNNYVIDQIPPLADFEQWLVQLSVVGAHQVWRHSGPTQKPFILELVAEMRQLLLKQLAVKWTAILDGQRQFLSDESPETVQRLAAIYDPENLETTFNHCTAKATVPTTSSATEINRRTCTTATSTCTLCNKQAQHRCSRCRCQHYCSKECQVADWPTHKSDCKPALKGLTRREGNHLLLLQQ